MSDDKRCGTCKWWHQSLAFPDQGECESPIPASLYDQCRAQMTANEGTTCPCWEAKE